MQDYPKYVEYCWTYHNHLYWRFRKTNAGTEAPSIEAGKPINELVQVRDQRRCLFEPAPTLPTIASSGTGKASL